MPLTFRDNTLPTANDPLRATSLVAVVPETSKRESVPTTSSFTKAPAVVAETLTVVLSGTIAVAVLRVSKARAAVVSVWLIKPVNLAATLARVRSTFAPTSASSTVLVLVIEGQWQCDTTTLSVNTGLIMNASQAEKAFTRVSASGLALAVTLTPS